MKAESLNTRLYYVTIGLLLAVTLVVFWQTLGHEFINYDDDKYVTGNANVQAGLTRDSIAWAFTSTHASNWHPLTWISHILDWQIYGKNPKGHHLTNLLLHTANVLLLFLALSRMTRKRQGRRGLWCSAFVAAAFAIHPLHVESVAWIAERKDVLSTFFWMLTMLSYAWYVERPGIGRYLPVLLSLTLGLLSKPMLVTLPFALLLLDYWPLGRFRAKDSKAGDASWAGWKLLFEKLPLFALAVVSSVITYLVQQKGGAVALVEKLPVSERVANTFVSYVAYIIKMLWPRNLAVFYPHPAEGLPLWEAIGAAALLVIVSVVAIRYAQRRPYLAVGWFWYLGTLVPVIGIVQVGMQAMADRYTYVPLIGLFIAIAWGVPDLLSKKVDQPKSAPTNRGKPKTRPSAAEPVALQPIGLLATAALAALAICSWRQASFWSDSQTLFQHAVGSAPYNYIAHNNLGITLLDQGDIDAAISQYYEAIKSKPDFALAHFNLGFALSQRGRDKEAISHFIQGLKVKPNDANANMFMGVLLSKEGKAAEAIRYYRKALAINPNNADVHNNLGILLNQQGNRAEALKHFQEALRIKPDSVDAHNNIGTILAGIGKTDEAIVHYKEALKYKPDYANAHFNLGLAFYTKGNYAESWREIHLAQKYGYAPAPALLKALAARMTEPVE